MFCACEIEIVCLRKYPCSISLKESLVSIKKEGGGGGDEPGTEKQNAIFLWGSEIIVTVEVCVPPECVFINCPF